jgi:DNA-binding response OmpR family regulator
MSHRILVVEDDRFLQENVVSLLLAEGYEVTGVAFGTEAIKALEEKPVDLVVLDLGLPDMDGITACRRIRSKWKLPIIMLTARTDPMDKVLGLETGADDYLTKPFNAQELIARVRAQLRRNKEYSGDGFDLGDLKVDYGRREVSVRGKLLDLTSKEYEVIAYLSQNSGRALSREQIFEHVWGYELDFTTNSLDVHMYRIRKKLEVDPESPKYLHTLRGYGYKLGL